MEATIVPYDDTVHRGPVADLWRSVFGYDAPHNRPERAIDKKLAVDDGLFFVALCEAVVTGTVMAGYDGHRGWIYALAVTPEYRGRGIGSMLLTHAEGQLFRRGCMKINLQIVEGNAAVKTFYLGSGYAVEARISMGKRLPENIDPHDDPS